MASRISNLAAIEILDTLTARFDVNTPGTIQIRSGSAPTNVVDTPTGTLLATLTFSGTAFGAATDANPGATVTAASITGDSSADATGTAAHWRALDGNGLATQHGDAAVTPGSGEALLLNTTAIVSGAAVDITAYTITIAEA